MAWYDTVKECVCNGVFARMKALVDAPPVKGVPDDWRCEEVFMATGHINITAAGEVAPFSCPNGAVIEQTGVGTYEIISSPPGTNSINITAIVDIDTRDGIHAHVDNSFANGNYWLGTGDNGGAADVPVTAPHSVQFFGKRKIVTCDVEQPEGRLEQIVLSNDRAISP